MSTAELQAFAGERLADYKVPRQVHYLAALPRNPGGKVLKSRLDTTNDRKDIAGP
jgi:acyl-CoA synthetase (AMP-forming)/AMP-acid ligase II